MVHPLLGKMVTIENLPMKIGFLRADCDAGVVDRYMDMFDPAQKALGKDRQSLLVRLSDLSVIRKLGHNEDYDKAVLEMKGVSAALSNL